LNHATKHFQSTTDQIEYEKHAVLNHTNKLCHLL